MLGIFKSVLPFLPPYGCIHGIWSFPGQRLELSHSAATLDLLTLHRAGARTHTSAATQDAAVGFLPHCTTVGTPAAFFLLPPLPYSMSHQKVILLFKVLVFFYCGYE